MPESLVQADDTNSTNDTMQDSLPAVLADSDCRTELTTADLTAEMEASEKKKLPEKRSSPTKKSKLGAHVMNLEEKIFGYERKDKTFKQGIMSKCRNEMKNLERLTRE